jgi:hypothetical protein
MDIPSLVHGYAKRGGNMSREGKRKVGAALCHLSGNC